MWVTCLPGSRPPAILSRDSQRVSHRQPLTHSGGHHGGFFGADGGGGEVMEAGAGMVLWLRGERSLMIPRLIVYEYVSML